jgi:hypothetical protein
MRRRRRMGYASVARCLLGGPVSIIVKKTRVSVREQTLKSLFSHEGKAQVQTV